MPISVQAKGRARRLRAKMIAHIADNGPTSTSALCIALERSKSTVYHHAKILSGKGRLHNIPQYLDHSGVAEGVWHLGPDPRSASESVRVSRGDVPIRTRRTTWPPHHCRDYLVAAFFGGLGAVIA